MAGKLICIVIIIICLLSVWRIRDELITGFWKCPADFLADAGLTSFLLYIGPSDWFGSRPCYILAIGDDVLINEPASVKLSMDFSLSMGIDRTYTAKFSDLETEDFPSVQSMALHKSGKLVLSAGDTVYAVMYKDGISTDALHSTFATTSGTLATTSGTLADSEEM